MKTNTAILDNEDFIETLEVIREAIQDTLSEITKGDVTVETRVDNIDFQYSIEINGFRRLSPSHSFFDIRDEKDLLRVFLMAAGLVYVSYLHEKMRAKM